MNEDYLTKVQKKITIETNLANGIYTIFIPELNLSNKLIIK